LKLRFFKGYDIRQSNLRLGAVELAVNFPEKNMVFDQPLIFINNKLPVKQPAFYIKLLVSIAIGSILISIPLESSGVNETIKTLAGFSFAFLAFSCFFVLMLSHLYNVNRTASDYVNIHVPIITTSKTFNKISDAIRSFLRMTTILYTYILLLFILALPILAVVSALAS